MSEICKFFYLTQFFFHFFSIFGTRASRDKTTGGCPGRSAAAELSKHRSTFADLKFGIIKQKNEKISESHRLSVHSTQLQTVHH